MDDRALAEVLADGRREDDPDGLLAVHDAYADRLFGYGLALLGTEDAATGAVRDALIVAAERATALPDPDRLRPWLYALTRNECVRRRRHGNQYDPDRELVILSARHLLTPAEIAAVLGLTATETADRLRTVPPAAASAVAAASAAGAAEPTAGAAPDAGVAAAGAAPAAGVAAEPMAAEPMAADPAALAPPALREQLLDATAPDAADYRAALIRRAGPFDSGGFPRPLDQHRITGRAVAWSTAAVVLIALVLLVVLPGNDTSADPAPVAQTGARVLAPGLTYQPQPSFGAPNGWPIPAADTLRPTTGSAQRAPATTPPPSTTASRDRTPRSSPPRPVPPVPGPASDPIDGQRTGGGAVFAWYQNQTAPACPADWTALLRARVLGLDPVTVVARWDAGGRTGSVALQRGGAEWVGTLRDLPTGRSATLVVEAVASSGDTAESRPQQLLYRCS